MKKILCLVIAIILIMTCVGCNDANVQRVEDTVDEHDNTSMFVIIESGYMWNKYNIVYHKETKVMYTVSSTTVFTAMIDAEGKPLLYSEG